MSVDSDTSLVDSFGRQVSYLRLSVTDRCDFRCVYCMDEEMSFVPRSEVLSHEEIQLLVEVFVSLGVRKLRLTGGEPLVRKNIVELCASLSRIPGLDELVMTSNGSRMAQFAGPLRKAGVKRVNISLDSLNHARFRELTRTGKLDEVLSGIDAACDAGFEALKLNAVILKGRNDDEVEALIDYAINKQIDISFIEEMPLGVISEHSRAESFLSSDELKQRIATRWDLDDPLKVSRIAGPSVYYPIQGTHSKVGFISPHSHNFCAACNRVRVTAEGKLLLCLGNEHSADLKTLMRRFPGDKQRLRHAIVKAMNLKPEKHHFDLHSPPDIVRFMNATGG